MKQTKFTIKQFNNKYRTDDDCLQSVFEHRYGTLKICPECNKETNFYKVRHRMCYACQYCSYQLFPLAGTIFHKTSTSLRLWFYAIFLFSKSKNGVSGMELQRQLGVTQKTAWRMGKQIRVMMGNAPRTPSLGVIEVDETYIGGKKQGKPGRGSANKMIVVGAANRYTKTVELKVIDRVTSANLRQFIDEVADSKSLIITDDFRGYRPLKRQGYTHSVINHSKGHYARGLAHTNTIEGAWSQIKRSIFGTYHQVSKKYLPLYLSEFSYRYNLRNSSSPLFYLMIERAAKPV
jgi:transposase